MNPLNEIVIDWYEIHMRDLPWRKSTPWGVLVSEFMLQQTPVARVLPKWSEWMQRWPGATDLSKATPGDAISAWGRLGYPRRALRLYESAVVINREFNGEVPTSEIQLRSLPGVGEYTAAAISAFAFQQPSLVLDVNIRRLFSRALDGKDLDSTHITAKERASRLELMPLGLEAQWSAATMELGAIICTSRNPNCDACPLNQQCLWRASNYPKSTNAKKSQLWHGTDRKCRGTIVQALRENKSLVESELKLLWPDPFQVERALVTLIYDGLISRDAHNNFALPNSLAK